MESLLSTFTGSNFKYRDVGFRGNTALGIHVSATPGVHKDTGPQTFLVVRFVALPKPGYESIEKFTHFKVRGPSQYVREGQHVSGLKLNAVYLSVFKVPLCEHAAYQVMDDMDLFPLVASWVREQCVLEGFEVAEDSKFAEIIRESMKMDTSEIGLSLEFPDLKVTPAGQ